MSRRTCIDCLLSIFLCSLVLRCGPAAAEQAPRAVDAREFVGAPLTNLDGEDLGTVSELVFDLSQAYVSYAVVTLDGGSRYALPWPAIRWTADEAGARRGVTDWTARQLAKAADIAGEPAEVVDLSWAARSFAWLGYDPYWTWWYCSGGWGPATVDARVYDPQRLVTVEGQITRVERYAPPGADSPGVRLWIDRGDEPDLNVHLGPVWYLEHRDVELTPGDVVEVRGTEYVHDGVSTLVAGSIVRNGTTLPLRYPGGVTAWAGWTPDGPPRSFRSLSDLEGAEVKTVAAETVGRIERVMLDPATGVSPYMVLADVGERRFVPLPAIAPGNNVRALVFRPEIETLRSAPPADADPADPVWLDSLYVHYGLPAGMYAYARPWRTPDEFTRLYDPDEVITLRGPVLGIYHVPLPDRRTGITVRLAVGGEFPHAYLGPLDYLDLNDIRLGIGDYIEVTGACAVVNDKDTIIADSVRFDEVLLKLRNSTGQPLWCVHEDAVPVGP